MASRSVIAFAARNGAAPLKILPISSCATAAPTFRQVPTGGVQAPTANPDTRSTPKRIGETPRPSRAGANTGVSNRIAGLTSITVPAARTIKFTKISVPVAPSPRSTTKPAMVSGTLSRASTQM